MPETIQRILGQIREFLNGLSTGKKLALASVVSLVLVGGAVLAVVLSQNPYRVLYSDLETDEMRAVVQQLGSSDIPHRVSPSNETVLVPESMVDQARMELAKVGLPGQDVVGFEKFDGTTLGMSSYVQRIQYVRAIQGELTRSIERLDSVKRARVHISIPPKKTFLEDSDPPKASIVLELRRGQKPTKSEINGIAHLVASAVEGLKVKQISIVNTAGTFLHQPGNEDAESGKSTALLELQRSIERDYEKRVQDILTPIVGAGKVRAKVTVDIDPSRVNTTEETFNPDLATPRTAVRNEETITGSRPNPIGIPGSRSNLPGAEVQNPPVPRATTNTSKVVQNQNFAVPRKITVMSRPSGSIQRMTVAVVVDGNYLEIDGGGREFEPRPDEELNRLRDLVANSIGFDEGRRDSITITSMPFTGSEFDMPPEVVAPVVWWKKPQFQQNALRNGLLGLVALLFFFLVVRPFLKWTAPHTDSPEVFATPRTVAELEGGTSGRPALSAAEELLAGSEPLEKKEEEELKDRILKKLESAPGKGLRIVQDWLEEGVSPKPVES